MTIKHLSDQEPIRLKEDRGVISRGVGTDDWSSGMRAVVGFLIGFIGVVMCGVALWPFLPHRYEAVATIILRARDDTGDLDHALALRQPLDDGAVQSELDVMASLPLAKKLVDDYHLSDDPELAPRQKNFFLIMLDQLGAAVPNGGRDPVRSLQDHLIVNRDKRSYTVRVGYWSNDPEKAARWANALVAAYCDRQIETRKAQADRRADHIRTRLLELAERASDLRSMASLEPNDEWTTASLTDERNSVMREFAMTRKTLVESLQIVPQAYADAEVVAEAVPPLNATFPNPIVMALAVLGLGTLSGLALVWGGSCEAVKIHSDALPPDEHAHDA